ncbi:MAG: hypothetical protein IJO48_05255, partial [Clostridia bacterium]|nr:hypothetical protein [Clostridia bacterium]
MQKSSAHNSGTYATLFMSVISGAPCAARMLKNQQLDIEHRTRLCAALNTISPMFTISVFAQNILKNPICAAPIILAQFLSVFIMLIPLRKTVLAKKETCGGLSLPSAIGDAMNSMLSLCGTVIICLVGINVLEATTLPQIITSSAEKLLGIKHHGILNTLLKGILEVTNGCISIGELKETAQLPLRTCIAFGTFFVTFGGISVLIQSSVFIKLIKLKYIFYKLIQSIIAAVTAYLTAPLFFYKTADVFNTVSGERLAENATSMGTVFAVSMLAIGLIFL